MVSTLQKSHSRTEDIHYKKNWMPITDSKDKLAYGTTTNNIVECHNRTLKTFCTIDTTLPQFLRKMADVKSYATKRQRLCSQS